MVCQKILVPIDSSDNALAAAEFAEEMARVYGAELVFLYVVNLSNLSAEKDRLGRSMLEYAIEAGESVLGRALERIPQEINARARCVSGDTPTAILRAAEEEGAEQIVLGASAYGSLHAALAGSVSNYVLRHAPCPVTVVRARSVA